MRIGLRGLDEFRRLVFQFLGLVLPAPKIEGKYPEMKGHPNREASFALPDTKQEADMFKKWLTICFCVLGLWVNAATAREVDVKFDLVGPQGKVTEKSYPGKYLLLAIGYTSCPDICPTTLYEYGLAMKAIKNPDAIQPVFVTIDPVNDEVGHLNTYTHFFDEKIVGLTGEMKNIQALADLLGATFGYRMDGKKIDSPKKGMSYTVYHSALIYLIDPNRKLIDVFDYQIGAEGLTAALDKVLGEGKGGAKAAPATESKSATPVAAKTDKTVQSNSACALPKGFTTSSTSVALKDILLADNYEIGRAACRERV